VPAISLFPQPRVLRIGRERFDFSTSRWVVVAPTYSANFKNHAVEFAAEVGECFAAGLHVTAATPSAGGVVLRIAASSRKLPAQGYQLTCDSQGITLEAGDEAGAFYGLQTLGQLIAQSGCRVPSLHCFDAPDFPARGVMLDISRCKVPTMDTLHYLVELFGRLKLNQLQLYTEHTFAYAAHETVWHDASPMTPEQIIQLDGWCREHYIELVPNQNSFGHFERWLRHPEYRHLAECPKGFTYPWGGASSHGSTLKPNAASLRFVDSLYNELLPNFSSSQINVGCDETWELGKGWSKPACDSRGTTRVYLDFLLGIHKLVRRRGRRMQFWGDIILHNPELVKELPKDIIALEWGYEATHQFRQHCRHFAAARVPFYVCPGTSSWNTLTGRTTNCLGNLKLAAQSGLSHGAIGYLNTDWGDGGHHQHLPMSYVGFLAGAAYSWCLRSNSDADIPEALNRLVFGDASGLMGRTLFDLGKVLELVPAERSNRSVFNDMCFADKPWQERLVKELPKAALRKCVSRFDELETALHAAALGCGDAELVKAEVINNLSMARFGARCTLAAAQRKPDLSALRRELQHIISRHEDLWLARNRRGGLRESSGRLRGILELLGE
jgi:hypothetical protein